MTSPMRFSLNVCAVVGEWTISDGQGVLTCGGGSSSLGFAALINGADQGGDQGVRVVEIR